MNECHSYSHPVGPGTHCTPAYIDLNMGSEKFLREDFSWYGTVRSIQSIETMVASQPYVRNMLLASLKPHDYAFFEPHLERVTLGRDEMIARADAIIHSVHFPEHAVISVCASVGKGARAEIGIVGAESMSGLPTLFGCDRSPVDEVVHLRAGDALRISRQRFVEGCERSPAAKAVFLRAALASSMQMGRTLVSNLKDPIERRLARWLLMRHDRLDGDGIELTHNYIAAMLGVRRATITGAIHRLEGDGAVRNVPGRITISDRDQLERLAGDAYGLPERNFHRMAKAAPDHWTETAPAMPMEMAAQA